MPRPLEAQIRQLQEFYWSDADPDGRGFVPLADALRKSGDLVEADRLLREGRERHPDLVGGHVVAGWTLAERGDEEEAEAAFRRALELDPGNVEALAGLAELLQEQGDRGEALGLFRRLEELDPRRAGLPEKVGELRSLVEVEEEETPSLEEEAEERDLLSREAPAPAPWDDSDEVARELDWHAAALQKDESWGAAEEEEGAAEEEEEAVEEGRKAAEEEEEAATVTPEVGPPEPTATPEEPAVPGSKVAPEGPDTPGPEVAPEEAGIPVVEEEKDFWVAEEGVPVPGAADRADALVTRTLAEIYVRQGLPGKAEEVLEILVERSPHDENLKARLEAVREQLRGEPEGEAEIEEPRAGTLEPEPGVEVPKPGVERRGPAPPSDEIVPIESLAPDEGEAVPAADLAPDEGDGGEAAVSVDDLAPGEPEPVVPIADLAPDRHVMRVEELAPEEREIVPVESLAPDEGEAVPAADLAPDEEEPALVPDPASEEDLPEPVPATDLAPDEGDGGEAAVSVDDLAPGEPEPVVPIADLAPDRHVMRVEELAPEEREIVPIESLAPDEERDSGSSGSSREPADATGEPDQEGPEDAGADDDTTLDAFQDWLDSLQ